MHFAFTTEQLELRDAVRDLLQRECPPEVVRAAWSASSAQARDSGAPKAWDSLATMGALAVLAPQDQGGFGLSEIDAVLLAEETGRVALPEPYVETALVAAPLGLTTLAAGAAGAAGADVTRAAVVVPESRHTPWADRAGVVMFLAADGIRTATPAECTLVPRTSVDGARRLFEVTAPQALARSAPARPAAEAARAFHRGVLGTSAQLLGLADTMLAMTVAYVSQREQFGVKIATFQAVKHHLADARTKLEFARPLVYRAAGTLAADDPDAGIHASMAKVQAGGAARATGRAALQCHGAIGYTTEYDLHLFMKRAWALDAAWGDATWHRRRVGRAIL